jgi:hypothetical protein
MALYCLISPGGSPGVTTTALALALRWPQEVVLAECDPAGQRVLPGFLAERLHSSPGPGLLGLAMALDQRDTNAQGAARVEDFTLPLNGRGRAWLLPGIRDPRHARQLDWPLLADAFVRSGTASGVDVIADLGRAGGSDTPVELLRRADVVVVVLGRSLAQVYAAHPRLEALQTIRADRTRVGLCVVDSGRYSTAEICKALFGLPVLAELPHAPSDARVLSDGEPQRLSFRTSLLMRATWCLGEAMRQMAAQPMAPPSDVRAHPVAPGGGWR